VFIPSLPPSLPLLLLVLLLILLVVRDVELESLFFLQTLQVLLDPLPQRGQARTAPQFLF
jgi:hypothetical protein